MVEVASLLGKKYGFVVVYTFLVLSNRKNFRKKLLIWEKAKKDFKFWRQGNISSWLKFLDGYTQKNGRKHECFIQLVSLFLVLNISLAAERRPTWIRTFIIYIFYTEHSFSLTFWNKPLVWFWPKQMSVWILKILYYWSWCTLMGERSDNIGKFSDF